MLSNSSTGNSIRPFVLTCKCPRIAAFCSGFQPPDPSSSVRHLLHWACNLRRAPKSPASAYSRAESSCALVGALPELDEEEVEGGVREVTVDKPGQFDDLLLRIQIDFQYNSLFCLAVLPSL